MDFLNKFIGTDVRRCPRLSGDFKKTKIKTNRGVPYDYYDKRASKYRAAIAVRRDES